MRKPALPAPEVAGWVGDRYGVVTGFGELVEGEESRGFGFDLGGRAVVLRIGRDRAGFDKDAFARTGRSTRLAGAGSGPGGTF